MKYIFQNFIHVLRRFKTSSILNILSLSAAFSVFIVIAMQLYYDFGFDRNFKKLDSICQIISHSPYYDIKGAYFNTQFAPNVASKTPLIENYTNIGATSRTLFAKDKDENTKIDVTVMFVSSGYTDMFEPEVIEGDFVDAISDVRKVAITEEISKKLFGNESPIGKTLINYYNKDMSYTVGALIKDFPQNCSFNNCAFSLLEEDDPEQWSYRNYIEVKKENQSKLNEFLSSSEFFGQETLDYQAQNPSSKVNYYTLPLAKVHLHHPGLGMNEDKHSVDFNTVMALLAIGLLTIVIAYINFVNFSVTMAPSRLKTLNLQRILGASKASQRIIVASESTFFTFIALAIAILCISFIKSSPISELFSADLALASNANIIAIICGISLILSFVLGLYPAQYITSFNTQEALKGTAGGVKGSKTRNILVTIQYTAAIALVIISIVVKMQHEYMLNYSWGIQKENIAYISMSKSGTNVKTLGDELIKDVSILDYTASQSIPGNVQMGWGRDWKNRKVNLISWPVKDNFLKFFGVPMVEGMDFTDINNPEKVKVIFNEEFLRKHELTADVIGEEFPCFEVPGEVMGIAKDFNFESLRMPISPMAFVTLGADRDSYLFIKLSGKNIKETLGYVETVWKQQSKEPLEIKFLDEKLETLYRQENNLAKLVGIFSIITILISIMGVYGLITFNTRYRAKEIAIRKVNGANEPEVIFIINRNVLIQFMIGFILSIPIAYYTVNQWVSQFAYKTPIYWWIFPLSALVILLVTVITVSWQSWKAATVNPVESLKNE